MNELLNEYIKQTEATGDGVVGCTQKLKEISKQAMRDVSPEYQKHFDKINICIMDNRLYQYFLPQYKYVLQTCNVAVCVCSVCCSLCCSG